jgi:hypothetical protein
MSHREEEVAQFNNLRSTVKEALDDEVKKVIVSCITNSPCVLVTG